MHKPMDEGLEGYYELVQVQYEYILLRSPKLLKE
jgi:hypothetical protein